jgi:hypothetical protein
MPKARRHPECFKPDRAKLLAQHTGWGECAKAVARCATPSILRIRYDFIRSKTATGALGRCRPRHPRSPSTPRLAARFTVFAYSICRASLPAQRAPGSGLTFGGIERRAVERLAGAGKKAKRGKAHEAFPSADGGTQFASYFPAQK